MSDGNQADRHAPMPVQPGQPCVVRSFQETDLTQVKRLAEVGLLPGWVGFDPITLEDIRKTDFWVAEEGHEVIGTVALAKVKRNVGHLRWLRVTPARQSDLRVAQCLVQIAVNHARELAFLKLLMHTPPVAQARVNSYLHQLGFEYSRNTEWSGRDVQEFYLNLYQRPTLEVDQFTLLR